MLTGELSTPVRMSGEIYRGVGTTDYNALENKPTYNGHIIEGDLTSDTLDIWQPKNFSTEEQNTGVKWIDGKDIYIKTIVLSGISGISITYDMNTLNCDKCIKTSGLIKLGSNGNFTWVSIPFIENGDYMAYAKWQSNGNILYVNSSWGLTDAVIIVEYTKMTN